MEEQSKDESTIALGPFSYEEAAKTVLSHAATVHDLARAERAPTASTVGIARSADGSAHVAVVRFRRLREAPAAPDEEPPRIADVLRSFPSEARYALGEWRSSGRNSAQITLGPFGREQAARIAAHVLPVALELARAESPFESPRCLVAVAAGRDDVGWEVVVSYTEGA